MPKAGSVIPVTFERRNSSGAVVTGKVLADFSFPAWLNNGAVTLTVSDFVEIGSGKYGVKLAMPSTLGRIRIDPLCANPSTDTLDPEVLEGDITANDIDDVAVFAARPPSVTLAQNVSPQSAYSITVYKGDGRTFQIPIYDDNGDLVNLTLWENFRFSIQNTAQTAVGSDLPYNQTTGISGAANGLLSVVLPETCSAYATHPAGHTDTKHWWSVDANRIADGISKTRTLRAGPFVIRSKETP
jgi:hypothetical protein